VGRAETDRGGAGIHEIKAVTGVITSVHITVALLDGQKIRRTLRTPPQKALSAEGVEAVLQQEAERVEQFFPDREFRLVPLRGGRDFNFVEIEKELLATG
jgi:hypothetical protein